jgi:hypothetical protein
MSHQTKLARLERMYEATGNTDYAWHVVKCCRKPRRPRPIPEWAMEHVGNAAFDFCDGKLSPIEMSARRGQRWNQHDRVTIDLACIIAARRAERQNKKAALAWIAKRFPHLGSPERRVYYLDRGHRLLRAWRGEPETIDDRLDLLKEMVERTPRTTWQCLTFLDQEYRLLLRSGLAILNPADRKKLTRRHLERWDALVRRVKGRNERAIQRVSQKMPQQASGQK